MVMDRANRSVDHHVLEIRIVRQRREVTLPCALLRPAPEARVDGEPFAELGE